MKELEAFLLESPHLSTLFSVAILIVVALFANFFVKRLLITAAHRLISLIRFGEEEELVDSKIIPRIANVIPALVFTYGVSFIPYMPEKVAIVIKNIASAFIVFTIALAICATLEVLDVFYNRRQGAENKPIKGYIQVLKIAIYCIAAILIISSLIDKSPLILFSGLGAIAAVLMLIFQDTILSLVASIQVSSNDMLRVGDWIEMPSAHINGAVTDIALHTVQVRNLDNTVTTFPTRRLISDPFKNWRGLQDQGGRCIQRAFCIDQNTIHFLTDQERDRLKDNPLLQDFWTSFSSHPSGQTTNISAFCAYAAAYLRQHPEIHHGLPILLRQLSSSSKGLPLEIYCFTATTDWAYYEAIQSEVFSYFYAVLPEFGLKVFQEPSGLDFKESQKNILN